MRFTTTMFPTSRTRGFSLVEVTVAAAVLSVGIMSVSQLTLLSMVQQGQTQERIVARLAMLKAREGMSGVRFRRVSPTDTSNWLLRGGYEIARDPSGASYQMPDVRALALPANGAGASAANPFM